MTKIDPLASILEPLDRTPETDGTSGTADVYNAVRPAGSNFSLLGSGTSVVGKAEGVMLHEMNTSDVRMDRVTVLKAAIENGTYNVSSHAVADKLIGSMLDKG